MKGILTTLVILLALSSTAQTKQVYYLSTLPTYDENGNVYQISQQYDHIPTREDSLYFNKVSRKQMRQMIDSVHRASDVRIRKIKNSKQRKNK